MRTLLSHLVPLSVAIAASVLTCSTTTYAACPPDETDIVVWEQGPSLGFVRAWPSEGTIHVATDAWYAGYGRVYNTYEYAIFFASDGRMVVVESLADVFNGWAMYVAPEDTAFKWFLLFCGEGSGQLAPIEDMPDNDGVVVAETGNPMFPKAYRLTDR